MVLQNNVISDKDKAHQPDERWTKFADPNVLAGTRVLDTVPHGASVWSRTARIDTEQADGSQRSFFIRLSEPTPHVNCNASNAYCRVNPQLTSGSMGRAMVAGELESVRLLHGYLPHSTPAPIASGVYASDASIHFFLCEFVAMIDELPDVHRFAAKIAHLHTVSASPDGRYGFPVPNYLGRMAQYTTWTDSWEVFVTNYMRDLMRTIEAAQDPGREFRNLFDQVVEKVIPRLLRPLESGGRSITPCLVHGDLYTGNVSVVDWEALEPVVYDATCLYAHNEWDLAPWGLARHRLGRAYLEAYCGYFPISAPEADFEDRNALYILRWEMKGLAIYPGDMRYRSYSMEAMRRLVEKFPEGYEGWAREQGETPAPASQPRSERS
ncbi:hypothetical protein M409DRAFT_27174 [Zasmidium cellare ATCC 36951]|uniref:protein-ribulosamine 3-kinase n=1 Tax=Zasmidium cellare ATCC 36951 TaxID=1080233 RepID=A0A6A6C9I3_ZASCE|nr:uncharacterized protein M409DRAFT_27174 [Zasmidium cellare ATCC 36951]KAF2162552.1 hypothetical protein M409DRAFT_27174 [Zasmidium cellare ATCC 36951]